MATALLIRHAHTEAIGRWLAGRSPRIPLSWKGMEQADRLGQRLAARPIDRIYTSPLQRAIETACAIARYQRAPIVVCAAFSEIDFGAWTGKSFAELVDDAGWRQFNERRSSAVIPGGERVVDVQYRVVEALAAFSTCHRDRTFAVVSHADVLRLAVLHYSHQPLDSYARFDIDPASVTEVAWRDRRAELVYVNDTTFAEP
jgi:probable phosphoglycerate mutase